MRTVRRQPRLEDRSQVTDGPSGACVAGSSCRTRWFVDRPASWSASLDRTCTACRRGHRPGAHPETHPSHHQRSGDHGWCCPQARPRGQERHESTEGVPPTCHPARDRTDTPDEVLPETGSRPHRCSQGPRFDPDQEAMTSGVCDSHEANARDVRRRPPGRPAQERTTHVARPTPSRHGSPTSQIDADHDAGTRMFRRPASFATRHAHATRASPLPS